MVVREVVDVLEIETHGLNGPRTHEGTDMPRKCPLSLAVRGVISYLLER